VARPIHTQVASLPSPQSTSSAFAGVDKTITQNTASDDPQSLLRCPLGIRRRYRRHLGGFCLRVHPAKADHDRKLVTLDGDVRGCIELKKGNTACGAKLIFGNCNRKISGFEERDLSGYDLVQLYSRKNTTMCMHVEPIVEGTYVRLRKCNSTSKFQKFEWYGQIKPTSDKTLCVAYPGQHASIGDYIKLKKCNKFNAGWSRD
jgi:hypothetical protein